MSQEKRESDTATRLLNTLKRCNPHRVLVHNGDTDEKPRTVAVPTRRRKWSAVIALIEAKPWTSCVLVDKAGDELAIVENDGAATEVEDLGGGMPAGLANQVLLGEKIASMCQQAADRALKAREGEVSSIMNAARGVMDMMGQAFAAQTNALLTLADVKEAAADARGEAAAAAASATGGDDWKALVDAIPTIMQAMPMLKQMLNGKSHS